LSTKAIVRYRKQERIQRQANQRIADTLSGDQRRILSLSQQGYSPAEIARELALNADYTLHFMTGLVQRLTHDGLIPSPEWGNVLQWATLHGLLA
jgi:DNA-binding CsgD family transcriptional regulator